MGYPYRECKCGEQIHVGSQYQCDKCLIREDLGLPLPVAMSELNARDWFAGQVLQGFAANGADPEKAAIFAYRYADAMLKARSTETNA